MGSVAFARLRSLDKDDEKLGRRLKMRVAAATADD